MSAVLTKDIITETYHAHEGIVWDAVWRFWSRYGGDVEEYKSQANLCFMKACSDYNGTTKFATWVYSKIWRYLKDLNYYHRKYPLYLSEFGPDAYCIESSVHQRLRINDLFEQCSDDAQQVLHRILYAPDAPTDSDLEQGFRGRDERITVKAELKASGWTSKRIRETFKEIKGLAYDYTL